MIALVVAVICEALVEYSKSIVRAFTNGEKKTAITQVCAILISILLCFLANADIFALCGITFTYPIVGIILTGIFASRGANYVSDLIKKIQGVGNDG